jgi:4-diphosphocytidyl-2-C-methyl-D-erythritol kinase
VSSEARSSLRGARAVEVAAQAKVNLRLRILAREDNGYHQIETLFLRLDLSDIVRVRRTSGSRSLDVTGTVDLSTLGKPEHNLAWRTAEAYLAASGERDGFAIEIEKRIPVGGGLGGGSADAGAVLRALDATSESPLGEIGLLSLAARLGADVPFLAGMHPYTLAWGRGERMFPLTPPPVRPAVLIIPRFAVNTAQAYGWFDEAYGHKSTRVHDAMVLEAAECAAWSTIRGLATNHFEPVVAMRHPEVTRHVDALLEIGCEVAMLSGSGSTVFGIAPASDSSEWHAAVANLRNQREHGVVVTQTASRVEPVLPIE